MENPENPDDLPRSPTGRVPKWVVDERLRGRVEETEFGPPPRLTPARPGPTRNRRRLAVALPAVVALLVVGFFGWVAVRGPSVPSGATSTPLSTAATGELPVPGSAAATRVGFPTPGYEEEAERVLPPVTPPKVSSPWRALRFQNDAAGGATNTPVMWDPCRPIRYVVRPDGAPPGGAQLIAEAFRTMERVTGLEFVPDGTIDEAPGPERPSFQPGRYGDRWAPVLVGWQDPDENPALAGDVAGRAGPASASVEGRPTVYVSGSVELDAAQFREYLADPRTKALARALLLHELGHLVGLDHVTDRAQLMNPTGSGELEDFGDGDRAGLAALGRGPCAPWL